MNHLLPFIILILSVCPLIVLCLFFFSLPLRTVEAKNKWCARRDNCHWIFPGLPNLLPKQPGINPSLTGVSPALQNNRRRANFPKLLLNHKIIEFCGTFWGHLVHHKPQTGSWLQVTSEANQLPPRDTTHLYRIHFSPLRTSHPVELKWFKIKLQVASCLPK